MKRIVTIHTDTGHVASQWQGGDEQDLEPVAGRTHLTLAEDDTADYSGQRWDGTAFERPVVARAVNQLDRLEAKVDALIAR